MTPRNSPSAHGPEAADRAGLELTMNIDGAGGMPAIFSPEFSDGKLLRGKK